jgi:excinuclease UvrABC helicase subunit UvrB
MFRCFLSYTSLNDKFIRLSLFTDEIAKIFWINTTKGLINKFAKQCLEFERNEKSAERRVEAYKKEYSEKVEELTSENK